MGVNTTYQRIKTIKETEKSRIYLVFEDDAQTLLVEKHLQGHLALYRRLVDLHHPYLPKLHDVRFQDGETVIWEEYIHGASLAEIKASDEQLSQWLFELCDVVDFLHQHKIIHRDIKPSNLLLGQDGHIRLIDFDAAREHRDDVDSDTRLLGTKGFAPPEQYGFAQTDQRADIYAIGVTWKALLGSRAAQAQYRRVLQRCTDLNPEKRYASAKALALAWKTRRIRQYFPVVCGSVAVLAVLIGWNWYQSAQPNFDQKSYPDEELLFYALDSDYIVASVGDVVENGTIHTMSIDLDGDRKKETFEIKRRSGGNQPEIVLTANTPAEKALFSGQCH